MSEGTRVEQFLDAKTGLKVSYRSLSPSVLSGINIRGIVLRDAETDKKLIEIKKATISYSLRDFISKEPLTGVKKLVLDGVTVEYDAVKDQDIIDKIKHLTKKTEKETRKQKTVLPWYDRTLEIPFTLQLKNLSLHYQDFNNDFTATIKSIMLEKTMNIQNGVSIKTSGRLEYKTEYLKQNDYRSLMACGFSVSGTVFQNLDGSSFLIKLSENTRADYSISRLELLVNYDDDRIVARTLRNSLPYSILSEADLKNQTVSLSASAEDFDLFRLIRIRNSNSLISKIRGTLVSGKFKGTVDYSDQENLVDNINFTSNLNARLSKNLLNAEEVLFWSIDCNNGTITVNDSGVNGSRLEASYQGSFDLKEMQPEGVFTLDHMILENGGVLQTEVYVDPYKNGFMCFAPQFFMDSKSFTALQLTVLPTAGSVDFVFECDDYSHADYDQSGHIKIDGSYLTGNDKVVQASVVINDMFMDSIILSGAFFGKDGISSAEGISQAVSSYIISNEVYLTTDFETFTFNSPLVLVANTAKERELLTLAIDGSNQTVNLSNLNLQFGDQSAHMSAGLDFNGSFQDFNFYTELILNSLPYNFSGSYNRNFLNVSGDYGFAAAVEFDKNLSGTVDFTSLPIAIKNTVVAATTNTNFTWNDKSGFEVEIENLDIDEPAGKIIIKPHLVCSGSVNKYGFSFPKIAYSDSYSALDGQADGVWNINDSILDSIIISLSATSLTASETISLNAEFTNPEKLPFSGDALQNGFYLSAQGSLQDFILGRFLSGQGKECGVSADFSASGTIANPFVTLNLHKATAIAGGEIATVSGNAVYDDTGLTVSDVSARWSFVTAQQLSATFDYHNMKGEAKGLVKGELLERNFSIPLEVNVYSLATGSDKFASFIASIKSASVTGTFFPESNHLDITVNKNNSEISVISDGGKGITAVFNNGAVSANSGSSSVLDFNLSGKVEANNLDLSVTGIHADLKKVSQKFNIPAVNFNEGVLTGAVKISGLVTDPEFTGAVSVSKAEFYVPFVSKKMFRADKVFATAGQNSFKVKPTLFTLDKNPVTIGLNVNFDRWGIDVLDVDILTEKDHYVPVDIVLPFIHYKGNAGFDMGIHLAPASMVFEGDIIGEKSEIEVITQMSDDESEEESDDRVVVDLNILVNNKVQILLNPVLRGLVVPGSSLELFIDTGNGGVGARGDVKLRGGEVVWLNRNFYMKEGRVQFNETQDNFDPRITVRAETRERDANGAQVNIILSANAQKLSQFNPRLSSSPARSETEILELLGQVISADSENVASLAGAGGDYLVQATVMRGIENTLREACNFDIFSIRTNVLQNAVKQTIDKSSNKQMSFGNFFDNSTVYIGKYFGSAMYVDALMHWNYDDTKVGDSDTVNGLVFQPQFGLEMESPYVNIRLGVAPDLEAIRNSLWIPSTSITLSWKHSF